MTRLGDREEEERARDARLPDELCSVSPSRLVDLDVREDLRSGREPFARIMAAVQALRDDEVLRLRAIFEPVPLYRVLGKRGFAPFTEELGPEDWRVWFYRAPAEGASAATEGASAPAKGSSPPTEGAAAPVAPADDVVVLDVRGLEPPEPMVRTLEALAALPRGRTLVQLNVRVPQLLLPKLVERGFTYEVREQGPDLVRVFIRHV